MQAQGIHCIESHSPFESCLSEIIFKNQHYKTSCYLVLVSRTISFALNLKNESPSLLLLTQNKQAGFIFHLFSTSVGVVDRNGEFFLSRNVKYFAQTPD